MNFSNYLSKTKLAQNTSTQHVTTQYHHQIQLFTQTTISKTPKMKSFN